jgi:type I restriction enzyme S subunit
MSVATAVEDDEALEAEGSWPLPEGWAWAKLREVADVIAGQSPPSEWYNTDRIGLPFYQGKSEYGPISPSPRKWCARPTKIAEPGDVLISVRAPVGPTNLATEKCGIGRGLAAIRPRAEVTCTKWLFYYLRFVENRVAEKGTGTTFAAITTPVRNEQLIPIAARAEQSAVVRRIDELFAEIAEGEAALGRARSGVDTWRRALLKAAVTGELTRDWREANRHSISSGPGIVAADAELPDLWRRCRVEDAGLVTLGRQRAPQHHTGPHLRPYLRVANVMEDRLDLSDVKEMNFTPEEFTTFSLKPGDVLLNEGQSKELVGRSAIFRGEIQDCCFQNTLIRFRAKSDVLPEYAQIYFRFCLHNGLFSKIATITTNIAHLSRNRFASMYFPKPPIAEQRRIVDVFQSAEAGITDLAPLFDSRDRKALRQSILKAAFEGHLVPQDLSDEPASALLARLRTEAPPAPRRARGRKVAP